MRDVKHILVIDDDEAVRRAFELALEDSGYEVTLVDGGQKGVDEVQKNIYDLVFLDLKMPGMDGVATLKKIRAFSMTLPVYIVTGFHREFLAGLDEVRQAGLPFQLLRKPVGSVEILALAHSALDKPAQFY